MNDALLIAALALGAANLALLIYLARRRAAPTEPVETHARLDRLREAQERLERGVLDQLGAARRESGDSQSVLRREVDGKLTAFGDAGAGHAKRQREELALALQQFSESASRSVAQLGAGTTGQLRTFAEQLKGLSDSLSQRLEQLRAGVEDRLKQLQEGNTQKLEHIRVTVDEKLQGALERRLGESFKLVSERLEQVHRGLGEVQALSTGVTDLRRVMSNVKTRGTWGEWQLAALLEELLTPAQYQRNFRPRPNSAAAVEFAVKMPGPDDDGLYLPIDSKFPIEDFQRLIAAAEAADGPAVAEAGAALEASVKVCARAINEKYICPPRTTDYAVLFLPTESLYAEVLRRPGLGEVLQRDCRVMICGPTTLAAVLNCLQVGFRTTAIQKHSGQVYKLLEDVQRQFGAFAELLRGVQKKLEEAGDKLGEVTKKSDQIGKKLRSVESLPAPGAASPALPALPTLAADHALDPGVVVKPPGSPLFAS